MRLRLKKELSLWEAVIYGVGIILGAGIYALIGKGAGLAGNSIWLSFILAAIVSSFTGLSYAELSSMFPKAAAEYVYAKNAFKSGIIAFLIGWIAILSDIIAASTVALGFATYFYALFNVNMLVTAVSLLILLSVINFLGIKESAKLNIAFSIIEVFGLILIIIISISFFGSVNYFEMPYGARGILSAAALIFFAYIGFEDLANIAEETKRARKNIPKALILSIIITTTIYILVSISVVSLVNWKELSGSTAPLALAASKVFGDKAFLLMSTIALFATANTVLVLLIVGSRMIYGMSREGILPKAFSKIHKKRRTPWISVFFIMFLTILFSLFGDIKVVASITDFGIFIIFLVVNASTIFLRYKMPKKKREFKLPLNIKNFPLISFFGLISAFILLIHLELLTIVYGLIVFLVGIPIYFILKKRGKIKI